MRLFRTLVRLRVVLNLIVAVVYIWWPDCVLSIAGMAQVVPIAWVSYAGVQIAVITIAYLPAAVRPERNRGSALFACFATIPIVILFAWNHWWWFAIYDLVFIVLLTWSYRRAVMSEVMEHP